MSATAFFDWPEVQYRFSRRRNDFGAIKRIQIKIAGLTSAFLRRVGLKARTDGRDRGIGQPMLVEDRSDRSVGFQIFENGGEYRQRYAIAFRDCQRGSQ